MVGSKNISFADPSHSLPVNPSHESQLTTNITSFSAMQNITWTMDITSTGADSNNATVPFPILHHI
jgi:hypothetical protein